jgi:trehalose 6-phosphate synthase/phosphatase
MKTARTIIVSNRLPVKITVKHGEYRVQLSEGGLATGLSGVQNKSGNIWVGWQGAPVENRQLQAQIEDSFRKQHLIPVTLSEEEVARYYEGFSNETLWPLFHYFPSYAQYIPENWEVYKSVNQKFAEAVLNIAQACDTIWIHDYQLLLVPKMIRDKRQDLSIGFFQHIPFPSFEVFRLLPWREQLLEGIMGADLIGFHTYDDVRHFISATSRILNLQSVANELLLEGRAVQVDAFPMGIDANKYRNIATNEQTIRNQQKLAQLISGRKLMLSIDRLDYSKGILERLNAFELFLETYPEEREKIVFVQLVVPSRDSVKQYANLREEINKRVSDINARYGTLTWQPISYFYRSFPITMLAALYTSADIALVAPLRDGMNLVCKEFVACKVNQTGVLILSEMAGASKELYEAIIINPNNKNQVAAAIYEAINMPIAEQQRRMSIMQETVAKFNVHHWVRVFMKRLHQVKQRQLHLKTKSLKTETITAIKKNYDTSKQRLILLDYDGTLVSFQPDPLKAQPDEELLELLNYIYQDPRNKLVIISGRNKETLDEWLGHLPIDIIAEHGAWVKRLNQGWEEAANLSNEWKVELLPQLEEFEMRTPGSFIEDKSYSLAWHYRKVDDSFGELRAQELIGNLKYAVASMGLHVLEGNKVVEIKNANINKGRAAKEFLRTFPADFILTIGDDFTDEDTFKAMPPQAFTIKVGLGISAATYSIPSVAAVRSLLFEITDRQQSEDNIKILNNFREN